MGNDIIARFDTVLRPREPVKRHSFAVPASLSFEDWKAAIFYPINDVFETRSHLFMLFKNRAQTFLSNVGLTAEYFPPIFLKSRANSPIWQTTAAACEQIQRLFQHHQVPVIFVLIPAPYQVHEEVFRDFVRGFGIVELETDLEQPNRLLVAACGKRGVRMLDALPFLRSKASSGEVLFGRVDNHFNENGHQAFAEYLMPHILDALNINQTSVATQQHVDNDDHPHARQGSPLRPSRP